ncbi:hypothetical protein G4B88_005270 [Cannabis sativa]|uniref:Uncharacterized protein n=1 Tax=Cannabis sativa TaxID=3483 RepID=A0A7J6HBK3_CANSA|nr:hypothetical protein G4B88_005270 [Cannabis sativa]
MGSSQIDGRMEGWLYLIRSNRFGLQYSRKRYFVLEDHHLRSFKSVPSSNDEEPVKSAIIDSCIRVMDNGRESIHRKVFFIFTLYNTSNHNDQLKLGASCPEEAARWIHSFQEAALKGGPELFDDVLNCSKRRWQSFRLGGPSKTNPINAIDWTICSTHTDPMTSDVIAPSPWTIFGCQNGLRLFKEAKDRDSHGKWDDHPAIMAVGVVDGTSEAIFQTLMSLGPSRSQWDFCFHKGSVVEHLDGHTDIIHKQLYSDWLPWGMQRRDLLLRRYWRREEDGTYVILYHSVYHKKCPPQKGYVRACLKSGGYVISPVNQGKQSVVKHMLAIDWKFWKSYIRSSSARSITIQMLGRVAALRELFKAKQGYSSSEFSSGELTMNNGSCQNEMENRFDVQTTTRDGSNKGNIAEEVDKAPSEHASLVSLNDAADEFFDVPEPSDYDQSENDWVPDFVPETNSQDARHPKLSTAAGFVKKLHDLAVQKRGYVDLQDMTMEDSNSIPCCYGSTLPKDPTCNLPCSWATTDPSTFLIRGKSYLEDRQKVKAKGTLMQMVAADWLRSDKREDDLGGRPESIVQKYAAQGGSEFFFIVNIQVPGSTTYSLALYYMMNTPLEDSPLLESFVKGDDAYRNSRFKLIPYISKGSWIVKQSVGKKACLIGQALEMNYFHGKNYLELGIDIGSSTVARGVVSLVLGYLNNLVIEMAFLVQANTTEELPEYLLGTCRLNHLDASKAILIDIIYNEDEHIVCALASASSLKDDFGHCERVVQKWASSSLEEEVEEDKHTLKDLLFFLHIPRTGGRTYFHCFLRKLYPNSLECPRSYDKLRFDPRKRKCRLLVTHDDYSMISKLPKQSTSVVTILRDPVDRVFSTYEFSIEVAARFLVHPNLTSATQMAKRLRAKTTGVSTLDIWPWKYLVPWMREDLFARRDTRKHKGLNNIMSSDPYDMSRIAMPLQEYIHDPIAHDIVHNGATFQVAGLTNNSYTPESHFVRHCVQKYNVLGHHVLQVAKRRLDDMLYVGLTEEHRESATMFANVVGSQNSTSNQNRSEIGSPENDEAVNENMTVGELMDSYEVCISSLRKSQTQRRTSSLKRISPANFTKEARQHISDEVLRQIRSLNHLDMELYKYAQGLFAKQHKRTMQNFVGIRLAND